MTLELEAALRPPWKVGDPPIVDGYLHIDGHATAGPGITDRRSAPLRASHRSALEGLGVEVGHGLPVAFGGGFVVGRVVGHREPMGGGVILDRVLDAGGLVGVMEPLALIGTERAIVLGRADV